MSDKLKEAHEAIDAVCEAHETGVLDRDLLSDALDAAVKEATLAGFNSADDVVRTELVARAEAAERERDKQALSAGECLRLQQAAERERDEAMKHLALHHYGSTGTGIACRVCGEVQ